MAQINLVDEPLLDSPRQMLVNTVNCVGVMGKGVAKDFKAWMPRSEFAEYQRACDLGLLKPGYVYIFNGKSEPLIAHMTTKNHWRNPSTYMWIRWGLQDLLKHARYFGVQGIAMPYPGCGNGGLDKAAVHEMICAAFEQTEIAVDIHAHHI